MCTTITQVVSYGSKIILYDTFKNINNDGTNDKKKKTDYLALSHSSARVKLFEKSFFEIL